MSRLRSETTELLRSMVPVLLLVGEQHHWVFNGQVERHFWGGFVSLDSPLFGGVENFERTLFKKVSYTPIRNYSK